MPFRLLPVATLLLVCLNFSGAAWGADRAARICSAIPDILGSQNEIKSGGIGGTGHEPATLQGGVGGTVHEGVTAPGGISGTGINTAGGLGGTGIDNAGGLGGTGHEPVVPPGGIGGTGMSTASGIDKTGVLFDSMSSADVVVPPGGIGGTGIDPAGGIGGTGINTAGYLNNVRGDVLVHDRNNALLQLANGDAVCVGDKIVSHKDGMAKMTFLDGAALYVLKNTEIRIEDYYYSAQTPEQNRSQVTLQHGDIRSVSGTIAKNSPKNYSLQTPSATIRVIGTDFMVSHLSEAEESLEAGTYTKVISGEVSVESEHAIIRLRTGESSHVTLSGSQSILPSSSAQPASFCGG